ncbi:MAG: NAD-binding protein [Proteobacteria bacterium]|nr:NAD-binding protein [Pseudomonadota bacterium]
MQPMKNSYSDNEFPWKTVAAVFFFLCAMLAFTMGVSVTEMPEVVDSGILAKAYFSLSLFVLGGTDLGMPVGGTAIGRGMLWLAYFGSPVLAASTLISALLRALSPQSWYLRRLKDHIIVVGDGEMALSYLRVLRTHNSKIQVVVVCSDQDAIRADELRQNFGAVTVIGDVTHEFFLHQLRVERARKILLLDNNSMRSYEAASILISMVPEIGQKIVIHCGNLRFMRAMENTRVTHSCQTFNTYHLAATGLVRSHMVHRFQETRDKDIVILAGFGRFGQTILEELQRNAIDELETVVIIDNDAHRRVLIADEQMEFSGKYERYIYEGDISHPEVWDRLREDINLDGDNTVFVLGTGHEEENLRTALWIRRKYPGAMVIARSGKESKFASEVGQDHDIISISIAELIEENIPRSWIEFF